jgi:predicted nuclease of predicted toxin-antitoxin system
MPRLKAPIPFFTDQNVPDSVGQAIIDAGHELVRLRDVMDADTPDPIIAVACSRNGHVLVSHDNDFRQVSKRLKITQRQYQNTLHRIQLRCLEPESAQRVQDAMTIIEAEWVYPRMGKPMVIEISTSSIRILR